MKVSLLPDVSDAGLFHHHHIPPGVFRNRASRLPGVLKSLTLCSFHIFSLVFVLFTVRLGEFIVFWYLR